MSDEATGVNEYQPRLVIYVVWHLRSNVGGS